MAFKKDGETKVFISKPHKRGKRASQDEQVRYTIDDLVRDSETQATKSEEAGEEDDNVSN